MNYALLADSELLVKKELNKLINKYEGKYDCDIIEYDGNIKDFNIEYLVNDLNTLPFLHEHRIVILNNPLFLSAKGSLSDADVNTLNEYLKNPADFSSLIIYVDNFKIDRRKKIAKSIIKNCELYEPPQVDESMIKGIIEKDLYQAKININNQALAELVNRLSDNFENWDNELEKLVLYGKTDLNLNDIKLLVAESEHDNIFDLVNSVLEKNLKTSVSTFRSLPNKASEPIALTMLLASQFRLVHQVATLAKDRMENQAIASELKVHPYRVQIARKISRKYSTNEILSVLDRLSSLEQNIKGGRINPNIGFELFLIEVCTI